MEGSGQLTNPDAQIRAVRRDPGFQTFKLSENLCQGWVLHRYLGFKPYAEWMRSSKVWMRSSLSVDKIYPSR
jgi:hypothetical protein